MTQGSEEATCIKSKWVALLLVGVFLISGCGVYEENKSLKAKIQELEGVIAQKEAVITQLERELSDLRRNEYGLDACLERAKDRRESNLKANDLGGAKKGFVSVDTRVLENIQKVYRDDCEECYRKYGRK